MAWLIIIGDGVHNLADGIALGAAISQSLSLGLSTMFALIFHELPHEFGREHKNTLYSPILKKNNSCLVLP